MLVETPPVEVFKDLSPGDKVGMGHKIGLCGLRGAFGRRVSAIPCRGSCGAGAARAEGAAQPVQCGGRAPAAPRPFHTAAPASHGGTAGAAAAATWPRRERSEPRRRSR